MLTICAEKAVEKVDSCVREFGVFDESLGVYHVVLTKGYHTSSLAMTSAGFD